ncbi:MAG: helix-turn-helix transcriptional regulator [Pseudomonadota bacterium]
MKSKSEHIIVGKYLKEQRVRSNLTQSQVAQSLGYTSPQFISNIERGLCSAPIKHLKGFLKLYNLSLEELLSVILKQEESNLRRALVSEESAEESSSEIESGSSNLSEQAFGLQSPNRS